MREMPNKKRFVRLAAVLIALLVISVGQVVASPKDKPWKRLSRPEKVWSAFHPFKAKKVLNCARRAQFVTDSLEKAEVLTDKNGGQLDAFRHAYWMALMVSRGMRENVVLQIGERHERGNYIDFKKQREEDGVRSDSMMCVMDLSNNIRGVAIGTRFRFGDKKLSLIEMILDEIWSGKLYIISKNATGDYLDKDGAVIKLEEYKDKWYIPKVIVNSEMIVVPH